MFILANMKENSLAGPNMTKNQHMKPTLSLRLLLFITVAAILNAGAQTLNADPSLYQGKLPNGLHYYIRKNTRPQSRATIYLVVKAGSVLETERQRGLAHFIEHMSFNGTKNFPKDTQLAYLEKCGVRFGADLNAYTGFEETVYQLPIPTDDPTILPTGLRIVRDWAQEATLEPKDVDAERGVVIEEMRQRLGRGQRIQEKQFPLLLNASRYAARMPIGTGEVLRSFSQTDIKNFYHDWYRPDLQALIIVGDIDIEKTRKLITSLYSSLHMPAVVKRRSTYRIALDGKNRFQSITDPEQPVLSVEIARKHYQLHMRTHQDLQEKLQRMLFAEMFSSRLEKDAQQTQRPLTGLSGGFSPLMGGIEKFSLQLAVSETQLSAGFKYAWNLVYKIKTNGFSEQELQAAKHKIESQLLSSKREQHSRTSSYLADRYKQHFLTGEAFPGVMEEDKLYTAALNRTGLSDIRRITLEVLTEENRDILITAPSALRASLPAQEEVERWIAAAEIETPAPAARQIQTVAGRLMETLPQKGKILSSKKTGSMEVSEWQLSNGAKVIIKQTQDPSDRILFMATSPGGTSLYNDADFQSAANCANIVSSFGVGGLSTEATMEFMQEQQLSLQPFVTESNEGMQGSCPSTGMQAFLQLIHQRFSSPRADKAVFDKIISDTRQGISQRYSSPDAVFADTISAVLGGSNPRRTAPSPGKVAQITLERVMEIYRERYSNAGDFNFFFVGRIDTSQLRGLCEQYLASLPDRGKREKAIDLGIRTPKGHLSKTVRSGIAPKATVRLIFGGDYQYSQNENLNITALAEILQYRLLRRLREEESGVYTPQVASSHRKFPTPRYSFTLNFACDPARVEELISSALAEMKAMATNISKEDLGRFKAEQRRQNELALQDNSFYLGYLTSQYEDGDSLETFGKLVSLMESLEPSTLQQAATRLLNGDNYLRFVLLPAEQGDF
jgi:zinc protease